MKKKRFLLPVILMLVLRVSAQDLVLAGNQYSSETNARTELNSSNKTNYHFEFIEYDFSQQIDELKENEISSNYFGTQTAKKEKVFTNLYTYQVPVGPGTPATKTVIRKPAIYMATKKLFKYYKKGVKSNDFSSEFASNEYGRILDVAMSAIHQESAEFEDELSKTKSAEDLSVLFKTVVLVQ